LNCRQGPENSAILCWFFCPVGQNKDISVFHIYRDWGSGVIDYDQPAAIVKYSGALLNTAVLNFLSSAGELFSVRAVSKDGEEYDYDIQIGLEFNDGKNVNSVKIINTSKS
jgi:hypothetical protein